jgi:hypothetical protein
VFKHKRRIDRVETLGTEYVGIEEVSLDGGIKILFLADSALQCVLV